MRILKNKKSIVAILISSILMMTPTVQANCEQERAQIAECEEIIELANGAIRQQGELIATQSDEIDALKFNYKVVKQELDSQRAWYKDPALIIPLSFIAGALVMSQVQK